MVSTQSGQIDDVMEKRDNTAGWRQTYAFFSHNKSSSTIAASHCQKLPGTNRALHPHQMSDVHKVFHKTMTYQAIMTVRRLTIISAGHYKIYPQQHNSPDRQYGLVGRPFRIQCACEKGGLTAKIVKGLSPSATLLLVPASLLKQTLREANTYFSPKVTFRGLASPPEENKVKGGVQQNGELEDASRYQRQAFASPKVGFGDGFLFDCAGCHNTAVQPRQQLAERLEGPYQPEDQQQEEGSTHAARPITDNLSDIALLFSLIQNKTTKAKAKSIKAQLRRINIKLQANASDNNKADAATDLRGILQQSSNSHFRSSPITVKGKPVFKTHNCLVDKTYAKAVSKLTQTVGKSILKKLHDSRTRGINNIKPKSRTATDLFLIQQDKQLQQLELAVHFPSLILA
ncbi:hypothetical protein CSUB01_12116 [Colletotrichum sublineola]|uniref:Uncharacterized protein n=1 Tax=Colletotrichum sublineola TaxID=1173701 RepID=A0A066XN82_COLSU|nr:hypothetical protein CSUB01_12116 [Colletotrichum sublineola]